MIRDPRVRLRPTTPADLAFVTALERDPGNRELIGQWSDAEHLAAIAGEDGRTHGIIERDGTAAGYLIVYDCVAEGKGVYLKRILVADKGRGTGSAALRAFLDRCFARPDVDFVWLIVLDWNARAQAVYRKLGFEEFEPTPNDAASYEAIDSAREGAIRMRARLRDG